MVNGIGVEILGAPHRVSVSSFAECLEFYARNILNHNSIEVLDEPKSLEGTVFAKLVDAFAAQKAAYELIMNSKRPEVVGYEKLLDETFGLNKVRSQGFETALIKQLDMILNSGEFVFTDKSKFVELVWGYIAADMLSGNHSYLVTSSDKQLVDEALSTLAEREENIVKLYYRLDPNSSGQLTLNQIGSMYGIGGGRVRQIIYGCLRKLRHPSRSKNFKDILGLGGTRARVLSLGSELAKANKKCASLQKRVEGLRQEAEKNALVVELREQIRVLETELDVLTAPVREEVLKVELANQLLNQSIDDLELSNRSYNCLRYADIYSVGDLVKMSERELLRIKNFGKNSLKEIKDLLEGVGLSLHPPR